MPQNRANAPKTSDRPKPGFVLANAIDQAIVYSNREAAVVLGYPVNEGLSVSSWSEILHPDDLTRTSRYLERLLSGEIEEYRTRKRCISGSGSVVWIATKASGVTDQSGAVRWIAYCFELAEPDGEPFPDGTAALTDFSLVTWSLRPAKGNAVPGDGRHSGGTWDVSGSIVSRLHPDDRAGFVASVDRAVAQKTDFVQEHRAVCDDGSVQWMKTMVGTVLTGEGKVSKLVGASFGVPSRKLESKQFRNLAQFLDENWKKSPSIRELADIHGLSVRSIHKYFERRGTTPRAFLKDRRLREANVRLSNASRRTTVTGVALDCGFANLGHFARDYRIRFGELPSETLGRSVSRVSLPEIPEDSES